MCSIARQRQFCFLQCRNLISSCLCIKESKKQNTIQIQNQTKGKQKKHLFKNGLILFRCLFGILLVCLSNTPQLYQHPTRSRHWRQLTQTRHLVKDACTREWFHKKHAMTTTSFWDHRIIDAKWWTNTGKLIDTRAQLVYLLFFAPWIIFAGY